MNHMILRENLYGLKPLSPLGTLLVPYHAGDFAPCCNPACRIVFNTPVVYGLDLFTSQTISQQERR